MSFDLASLVFGLLAGGMLIAVYMELRHKIQNIEIENKRLAEERVKGLPHGTLATIEDIHGIINDVRFQNLEVDNIVKALLFSQSIRTYQDMRFEHIKDLISDIQDAPRKYKERKSRKVRIV